MANRVLSVLERAKMVCWFEVCIPKLNASNQLSLQETNSLAVVARRYRAEFGVEPPTLGQIKRIHRQFLQTGSVLAGSSSAKGQCAASSIEATFISPLLRKNNQLASIEAQEMSQLAAMNKGPIERFA